MKRGWTHCRPTKVKRPMVTLEERQRSTAQCYLMLAAAMYFDLGEQEQKCIIEEIPEDTLVTGNFFLEPWNLKTFIQSAHLGVTVTVRDPNYE
ncbi:hypothetical protein ILYODFUR_018077, partial [Ilyodon furcidens]